MPIDRRTLLLAGAGLPLVASCASDITFPREKSVEVLATELGVCSAVYVVLRAGIPGNPVAVAGCSDSASQADAVFQAASLTKPVVALAALSLTLTGRLDLSAPVSRYLPKGVQALPQSPEPIRARCTRLGACHDTAPHVCGAVAQSQLWLSELVQWSAFIRVRTRSPMGLLWRGLRAVAERD